MTIQQLLTEELTRRKADWKGRVERGEMPRAEANHRYRCMEDALRLLNKEACKQKNSVNSGAI
jgi:hypothetical protein